MHDLANSAAPLLPMLLLGQVSFQENAALIVLAGITFLAVAVNQLLQVRDRMADKKTPSVKVKPDPHSEYRTRNDCIAICEKDRAWIRRVEASVPRVEKDARSEMKEETDKLHQRVDTLHTSMNAQFNNINGRLCRIAGRLGIPEEQDQ